MFNPALLLLFISPDIIDKSVSEMNKCFVSGEVVSITQIGEDDCSVYLDYGISSNNLNYTVQTEIYKGSCFLDTVYQYYDSNNYAPPLIGSSVNFLVNKENSKLISSKKVEEGVFKLISSNYSYGNTEICEISELKQEVIDYGNVNEIPKINPQNLEARLKNAENNLLNEFMGSKYKNQIDDIVKSITPELLKNSYEKFIALNSESFGRYKNFFSYFGVRLEKEIYLRFYLGINNN